MKTLWRIYYADNTTFDNTQGEPQDAPSIGVICIKHFIEGEWRIQAFTDYYIYNPDIKEWWGADEPGYHLYMFKTGYKVVKFGENIKDRPFQLIMAKARNDTEGGMEKIV